ncbi:hypothetical protein MAR_034540 [Mya arenaria]|uniref:Uncharacterized protein n=1 Tax=Mya arenaria TaxID=6604 RepID=A0ABY7GC65_MYAAR|nr:hypothetical protein MAR_034540 [Mya arenaria]
MKWSILKEGGDFYLDINGNKACGLNGDLTISSAGAGHTKDEVWFKCKGEKVGKRLLRQNYNLDGDGAKDKVRVARRAYMKNEDSWKEEAVVSLGYIEGKLFRNLQSVADDKRTPYLSKAVGTNGVKVSRIIVADKRRENLKILACQSLNQQTWEDVEEHFFKSEEMLRYTGEISSPEGRGRYVTFVNKLSLNSDNCVIISIIVNGIERTFDNEILGKKIKEIKTLVEKEIMNEE